VLRVQAKQLVLSAVLIVARVSTVVFVLFGATIYVQAYVLHRVYKSTCMPTANREQTPL